MGFPSLARIAITFNFSISALLFLPIISSYQCSLSGVPGKRLQGRVCLVTGAARGIGKGIALGLGDEGATVYVTGRTEKDVALTANEVTSRGGRGIPVVVDHSNVDEIKNLFEKIRNEEDRLHLLVNNCYSAAGKYGGFHFDCHRLNYKPIGQENYSSSRRKSSMKRS